MTRSELRMVLDHGVVFVGFVSQMPSGQGMITNERIKELVSYAPSDVNTFLLTSLSDPFKIADQWKYCRTRTIQLCSPMKLEQVAHLKNLVPQARIVGVVHVKNSEAIHKSIELSEICDEILLDSGDPKSRIPKLGGTGKPHDWLISKSIKVKLSKRLWLAGGLDSENVIRALDTVGPDGVDVCSGVRKDGSLDAGKLRAFLDAVATWPGTEKLKKAKEGCGENSTKLLSSGQMDMEKIEELERRIAELKKSLPAHSVKSEMLIELEELEEKLEEARTEKEQDG